jgi:hypothetical protein
MEFALGYILGFVFGVIFCYYSLWFLFLMGLEPPESYHDER